MPSTQLYGFLQDQLLFYSYLYEISDFMDLNFMSILLRSSMEDDLKILKLEYLSNHLLNHTQILNLSQTIFYKFIK